RLRRLRDLVEDHAVAAEAEARRALCQVAIGDQRPEQHELVVGDRRSELRLRQHTWCGDSRARRECIEAPPALDRQERVVRRGLDLPSEPGAEAIDVLAPASYARYDPSAAE